MARKPRIGDLVVVEWVDAVCDTSEIAAYEASGLPHVRSWGELMAWTDEYIRIGGERLENSTGSVTYRGTTTIPAPWIKVVNLQ